MDTKLLDLYQAAVFLEISPELLTYFTKHTVKTGDARKLQFTKDGDRYLFEETELKSYDSWLRAPWPTAEKSNRPHLPKAIKNEIKLEASLECAVCFKHADSCEAAHIDPSHKGKCNHPHNLIWLCSTHHTKFDNGFLGPKGVENKDILNIKSYQRTFRRVLWQSQAEASHLLALILRICSELNKKLTQSIDSSHIGFEQLAKQAIELVPKLTKRSESVIVKPALEKLLSELSEESQRNNSNTRSKLTKVASFEDEFLEISGLVRCPLCEQRGINHSYDCPVCQGDGSIDENIEVDLSDFDLVDCKLCKGSGRYYGDDCRACGGEGEFERRFAEGIDYRKYDLVDCPVCKGSGYQYGDLCRACGGEKELIRSVAENTDVSAYNYIDCILCEGNGKHNGDTCPLCRGDREILQKDAAEIDLSIYDEVTCPVCKGGKILYGDDCIACGAEGFMSVGQAEELDLSLYDLVICPKCKGKCKIQHDECRACNNEGEVLKYYIVRYGY